MKAIGGLFLAGCLGVSLLGCAQFSQSTEKRVFETRSLWTRDTTEETNLLFRKINRMKPILYKNTVIQANGLDGISAFHQDSGQQIWHLSIANGAEPSGTLINDRLFFGASDGQFYSVNAATGKVLWTFPMRIETLSEPLLAEGVLYVLTGNNSLYALDAESGKQLWLYSRQDPSTLSIRGGSKPALRNGTLYVGFSDGSIVALLAQNGAVKWEKQLNKNKKFRDLDADPLVDGDFLYILGFDDEIYCLRSASGELVWKSPVGGYGAILASKDRLYFATTSNEFVAMTKDTGKKIWSVPVKEGIATSASMYKGLIVFGESQGNLRIVDATNGKQISAFNPGKGIMSPPTVDESKNRVYFISNEANLYALQVGWVMPKHIPYLQ